MTLIPYEIPFENGLFCGYCQPLIHSLAHPKYALDEGLNTLTNCIWQLIDSFQPAGLASADYGPTASAFHGRTEDPIVGPAPSPDAIIPEQRVSEGDKAKRWVTDSYSQGLSSSQVDHRVV